MIGLLVKVPFHSQIKRTEPRFAGEIASAVASAARATAARLIPSEESFFLVFEESSSPCRLRAAEAARLLLESFKGFNPRLHGWSLLLDSCAKGDDGDLRHFRMLWYGIRSDGLFLGPGVETRFGAYFSTSDAREGGATGCIPVMEALYARPALPAEAMPPPPSGPLLEELIDELGRLGIGDSEGRYVAVVGEGRAPIELLDAGLDRLYPGQAQRFLRFRASALGPSPYGPVVDGLSSLKGLATESVDDPTLLSAADRGLLSELGPIIEFLTRSPFREGYSPALDVRLRVCAAAAFRLYARECRAASIPAFVILDGIDRFRPRSLQVARLLLEESLAHEGISVIAVGSGLPEEWPREIARLFETGRRGSPSSVSDDSFASRARSRIAACAESSGAGNTETLSEAASPVELAIAALATFPPEYSELLLAVALGEEVLRSEDLNSFLDSLGYVSGIRTLIYAQLEQLGFLEGQGRPRVAFPEAGAAAERILRKGSAALKTAFAARLLELHGQHRIIPSLALYRRIRGYGAESTAPSSLRLFLDCVSADAVYGPSVPIGTKPDSPLAGYVRFLNAYAASDRSVAEHALTDLESNIFGGDLLAAAMASLARAAIEYSTRAPGPAARRAKTALMNLHSLAAPRAEARAHRILGLCALAQDQIQEGADYLSNAGEIAESIDDPLGCILSVQAEAAAHFVLGDMGRALARTAAFTDRAIRSFRSDWEMAGSFMEGRIAFELGAYAGAEEAFARVRAQARVYDSPDAAFRSEIWIGRAASAAGETDRARDILSRGSEDVEALWFLAELEHWEGRNEAASILAEQAVTLASQPGFSSADAFDWNSGFESIEGRAVGFCAGRSYLADQTLAFRDFTVGLSFPEQARERADRLALLTREERLSVMHPSLHLYLFYRYLILKESGESSMDSATALSKAFKALQLRSARISDAVRKDAFLERNRWNQALFAQARSHKLI